MAPSDADLHHAISLRPSPFHSHPERASDSLERSPTAPAQSTAFDGHKDATVSETVSRPVYHRNSSDSEREDVERQSLPNYSAANDPYDLRSGLKTAEEIDTIKANTSRRRKAAGCVPIAPPKDVVRAHKIKGFYEAQNERIEKLLRPVDEHVRLAREEQGADALQFKIAVNASFACNVLLAILQVYAAVSSGSLSLFTTMADAIFDPMRYARRSYCRTFRAHISIAT